MKPVFRKNPAYGYPGRELIDALEDRERQLFNRLTEAKAYDYEKYELSVELSYPAYDYKLYWSLRSKNFYDLSEEDRVIAFDWYYLIGLESDDQLFAYVSSQLSEYK